MFKLIFKGSILGSAKEDQDTAASLILLLTPGNVDFTTVSLYFNAKLTYTSKNKALESMYSQVTFLIKPISYGSYDIRGQIPDNNFYWKK